MDMTLEEYLRRLNQAIEAMTLLESTTPESIKRVVSDNYWQTQSAFQSKIERMIKFSRGE